MSLSGFTKSLVINLGERSAPERPNLHCLSPKAEFANSSERALDWSEISFIKQKGILPDLLSRNWLCFYLHFDSRNDPMKFARRKFIKLYEMMSYLFDY